MDKLTFQVLNLFENKHKFRDQDYIEAMNDLKKQFLLINIEKNQDHIAEQDIAEQDIDRNTDDSNTDDIEYDSDGYECYFTSY